MGLLHPVDDSVQRAVDGENHLRVDLQHFHDLANRIVADREHQSVKGEASGLRHSPHPLEQGRKDCLNVLILFPDMIEGIGDRQHRRIVAVLADSDVWLADRCSGGTDVGVSQKLLYVLWRCPIGEKVAGERVAKLMEVEALKPRNLL